MATDWTAIRTEYVNGVEAAALAKKYGVRESTLRQQATRHKWTDERLKMSTNVHQKAVEASVRTRAETLAEFNNDCLSAAITILSMASQQMQSKGVMLAMDIRALSGSVESAQRIGRIALGADSGGSSVAMEPIVGFRIVPYSTPD